VPDPSPIDQPAIEAAAAALSRGELVAFPTETFYGLAANALDPRAVDRLCALKGRDPSKPIPCIIGDRAQASQLCASWPAVAEKLAVHFWPGPLTLVLPARPDLPPPLHPEGLVGLRLSSHPWARALALELGSPITSTSANPAGGREASNVADLDAGLREKLGYILDGGPTPGGLASTIVRLNEQGLSCLRRGPIAFEAVEAIARGAGGA
jgi:L-threonylcarbamoyladenylate synthase